VLEPTECEADNLGSEDAGAQFYLRSLVFPDVAAVRAFLSAYQYRFGDACWVEATLRSLELSQVDPESAVALQYAGLTIRATPGGRVDADLQSAGMSRCSNLFVRTLSRHPTPTRANKVGLCFAAVPNCQHEIYDKRKSLHTCS
jgi:hypothetical protein